MHKAGRRRLDVPLAGCCVFVRRIGHAGCCRGPDAAAQYSALFCGIEPVCCISRWFRYKSNLYRQMQVIRRKVHLAVRARMLPGDRVRRGRRRLRHRGRAPCLQLHGPAAAAESAARSASPAAAHGRRRRRVRSRTGLLSLPSLQLHGPAVADARRRVTGRVGLRLALRRTPAAAAYMEDPGWR